MAHLWRTASVVSLLASGATLIGWTFWQQDVRYALPTPRPVGLVQPSLGIRLDLPLPSDGLPTLLTFYNPDCPCSRFNVDHVLELQRRFGRRVRFVAICQSGDAPGMRTVHDPKCRIARTCGVYATPQAVLLDRDGNLYYRGNFNRSRYCREPQSEYARIAIDALLRGAPRPEFPAAATTAYGCALSE